MKKFLNYIQSAYGFTNYQAAVIEYFFVCFASDFSKLFLIFTFFICIGKFAECVIALAALLLLRLSGGGYHCEHYISCFFLTFSYLYIAIFFSEHLNISQPAIILSMLLCMAVAYKLAPMVSKHRLEPTKHLIKRSRFLNILFLFIGLLTVSMFYTNHCILIIFWVSVLHSVQLIIAKFCKGGNYYVT